MRIVVPYNDLNPATEFALRTEYPDDVEFVDTSASEEAYFELIERCWANAETFVLVEHDIAPWPGALKPLHDCGAPLCCYLAPHGPGSDRKLSFGLGICKFHGLLMRLFPDHLRDPGLTRKWYHLDGELVTRLQEKGFEFHVHEPPVLHLSLKRFPLALQQAWPQRAK